jgi:hypothetical protein
MVVEEDELEWFRTEIVANNLSYWHDSGYGARAN